MPSSSDGWAYDLLSVFFCVLSPLKFPWLRFNDLLNFNKQNQIWFGIFLLNIVMQAYPIFSCSSPGHQDQQASYYCMESECAKNEIICVLCMFKEHRDHEAKPLKFIWKEIEKDLETIDSNIVSLVKIDAQKQIILDLCLRVEDLQIKDILTATIAQYFTKIQNSCEAANLSYIQEFARTNNKQKLMPFLTEYCKQWNINWEQNSSPDSNYQKTCSLLCTELLEKRIKLEQALNKGQMDISLAEIFSFEASSSKRFGFNPKLMHSGLTFIDSKKIKISQYADYSYFALCEPQLSVHKVQTITFKMNNLSSYVTLGICKKNKVDHNYEFITSGLGHGSYQVSYDGYTWSDTDASVNEHYSGWYFNQGETVTIEMNPKTKKLKFKKNNDEGNVYEMPFDYEKSDKLHFCVTMNSEPEEVEIVD